ncbi:hypothetical protein N5C10_02570 [Acinetobacter johnsonii]|uniref:Uncharacterized protein n=1 Tax=Acinetobacter johnsonii TaxID=40214 RepID=A0AA42MT02_ACIJO|nr:hypothetical protein [Acinetobacter johnsonii]MDH0968200.1 hypothetical protein [Acinetobacter johnsonii]
MHINSSHDILRKKAESRRLDIQVRWFLRKQKKQCPDQLPTVYSGLNDKSKQPEWTSSQHAMRQTMTSSVSKKRPVLKTIEKPLTAEQQRQKYNFDEKHKALKADLDTFTGKCLKHGETLFKVYKSNQKHHCIECKAEIFKRKKELAA